MDGIHIITGVIGEPEVIAAATDMDTVTVIDQAIMQDDVARIGTICTAIRINVTTTSIRKKIM